MSNTSCDVMGPRHEVVQHCSSVLSIEIIHVGCRTVKIHPYWW